jgi:hypothetical protein
MWLLCLFLFVLFFTRSGRPALASVPDAINCRILISEYVQCTCNVSNVIGSIPHDVIQHRGPTAAISIFPCRGISLKAVAHPSTDCPDVAALLYSNRDRCFNIVRPLALEFGLLCMVGQPSADTHVIWVARHKVTRPQTILKFRPPSSLDYRTRHGSQSVTFVIKHFNSNLVKFWIGLHFGMLFTKKLTKLTEKLTLWTGRPRKAICKTL